MATMAAQRARASAQAAIARAQAHVRVKPIEPEDNPDDVPITPEVARRMRLRAQGVNC